MKKGEARTLAATLSPAGEAAELYAKWHTKLGAVRHELLEQMQRDLRGAIDGLSKLTKIVAALEERVCALEAPPEKPCAPETRSLPTASRKRNGPLSGKQTRTRASATSSSRSA